MTSEANNVLGNNSTWCVGWNGDTLERLKSLSPWSPKSKWFIPSRLFWSTQVISKTGAASTTSSSTVTNCLSRPRNFFQYINFLMCGCSKWSKTEGNHSSFFLTQQCTGGSSWDGRQCVWGPILLQSGECLHTHAELSQGHRISHATLAVCRPAWRQVSPWTSDHFPPHWTVW